MALISFSAFGRGREDHADWRQDEIAELYRVLHLLQKAGLSIDYDRGVTDIGEPWFVFFDPAGEDVFLHVARLGGRYILVSDVLDLKVEGSDLRTASTRLEQAVEKIVLGNRERNSKVIAHPAAQMMLSIAAVFLIIKSKSAHAATDDDGAADGSLDVASKIRALINRLHEAVDNPALVAAMVSAIVLSSTSHIGDSQDHADLKDLIDTASRDYGNDGDAAVQKAVSELLADSGYAVEGADRHNTDGNADDGSLQLASSDMSNLKVAVGTLDGTGHAVENGAVEAGDDHGLSAEHATSHSDTSVAINLQADSVSVEQAQAVIQNGGAGSSDVSSVLLLAVNSDGDALLELVSSTSLALSDVVQIAESTSVSEVVSALSASTAAADEPASSPFVSSSAGDDVSADYPAISAVDTAAATDDAFNAIFELVQLFGEVNVYAYGQNQILIVDADVQNMDGGQLAFVTEEIHEGFEISLIGSRETISSYMVNETIA